MPTISEIAERFDRLECLDSVVELSNRFPGTILEIDIQEYASPNREYISHVNLYPGYAISESGLHYGFLNEGIVYDNLHPLGIGKENWPSSFAFFDRIAGETRVNNNYIRELSIDEFRRAIGNT